MTAVKPVVRPCVYSPVYDVTSYGGADDFTPVSPAYIVGASLTETPEGYDGYYTTLTAMNAGASANDNIYIMAESFSERLYFYKQLNIYGLKPNASGLTVRPSSLPKITQGANNTVLPYTNTTGLLQGVVIEIASSTKSAIELKNQGSGAPENKTFRNCTILSPSGAGVKTISMGADCKNILFDSCFLNPDRLYLFFIASGVEIDSSTINGKQIVYIDTTFSSTDDLVKFNNNTITSKNPGAAFNGFAFAHASELEMTNNTVDFSTDDGSVATFDRLFDFYSANNFKYNNNTTTATARFDQAEAFRLYSTHVAGVGEFKDNTFTITNASVVTPTVLETSSNTLEISGNTFNIGETSITRAISILELSALITSNEISDNTINIQSSIGTAIGWGGSADSQYLTGMVCNDNTIYGKIHFTNDTTDTTIATHGIIAKDQKNCTVRRNVIDGAAYGVVLKSYGAGSGLTFTAGDISYNFIKNSSTGGLHPKGAMGTEFYHNTLVSSMTGVNNSLCLLTANDAIASASSTTLKNNVFAFLDRTTNNSYFYDFGAAADIVGLASDYNVFINVSGNPNCFNVTGVSTYTFETWVGLGHDTHSMYIEKDGTDYNVYLGSAPTTISETLNYCPILETGRLADETGNPIVSAGVVVVGINDGSEADIWGNTVSGTPNIGADQEK